MRMKKKYEIMVIISGEITDSEMGKRLNGVKELLGKEIVYEEVWGIRDFAYPIKKHLRGHYAVWNFLAETNDISELKKSLQLYPDLLRYLIIKVPENYTPMKLDKIEKGLELLHKEKAEKRSGKPASKPKKTTEKKEKDQISSVVKEEEPKQEVKEKEVKEEDLPAAVETEEGVKKEGAPETPEIPEAPQEEPSEEEKRKSTLDEKLEKILQGDDLSDLGL